VTPDELHKAEARYQRAFAYSEAAREDRNRLVREALAEGWTHAKIAEVTGLSRGRVSQIR
jgi:DNA-directed RNA polymerase specialized sigma subunit